MVKPEKPSYGGGQGVKFCERSMVYGTPGDAARPAKRRRGKSRRTSTTNTNNVNMGRLSLVEFFPMRDKVSTHPGAKYFLHCYANRVQSWLRKQVR